MQIKVRDLKPGDILVETSGRMAVIDTIPGTSEFIYVRTVSLDAEPTTRRVELKADRTVEVERVELTPMQKEAHLLFTSLTHAVEIMSTPGLGNYAQLQKEWLQPAKNLIMQVAPQPPKPPTLAEALAALATLEEGAHAVIHGSWSANMMQSARLDARALLNRALATGVLP